MHSSVGRERGDFVSAPAIPANSSDVTDEPEARLVILSPDSHHRARNEASKAKIAAKEILEQLGNSPCIYRGDFLNSSYLFWFT